jgi:hypothetical protein
MERIKKKMVNATEAPSALNHMITLYKEYCRNCDRQPQKQNHWNKWFLQESFEYLNKYEYLSRSTI